MRTPEIGSKGLKGGALGFVSNVVIGVASTAPGYSLAATLGFVAAAVGLQSPAVLWLAFIPMLFIAASYYYMNKADPDCGTSFTWVTRAMGPHLGWITGWAIVVADVIVMANLAQIAGLYTFLLFGLKGLANSTLAVTAVGVVWIALMTYICYRGIELSARTQVFLLAAELVTLTVFAVVALFKVFAGEAGAGALTPSISWINPFEVKSFSALDAGLILAIFIYWGWDSTVTVNEESENSSHTPGVAAIVSTIVLLLIYVIVGIAAQAYGGVDYLVRHEDDVLSTLGTQVFGSPLDKILILAVLSSAAASTQTTILPTARTTFSMAHHRAMPEAFGRVHPRYLTPHVSTLWMGALSIVWYVGMTIVSENILYDSISALGLMIAFYYGLTGFACAIYYRKRLFRSVKNLLLMGIVPVLGGLMLTWAFVEEVINLSNPKEAYSGAIFGIGVPLFIGIVSFVIGVALMVWAWYAKPAFFQRRPQVADPDDRQSDR
ncbi:MAG: APC family permease [Rubrobacteraceae bacterium]|nr:APC family permease [Rubrobacteraceae bacterium]